MSTSIFLQKMNRGIINLLRLGIWELDTAISRKVVENKSRKVIWEIWDMNSTLFPTLQLSNLLFLLFFSTRKHTFMTSRTILSNFFEEQWTQNRPTVPFGIVACTFFVVFTTLAPLGPGANLGPLAFELDPGFSGMRHKKLFSRQKHFTYF